MIFVSRKLNKECIEWVILCLTWERANYF